MGLLKHVIFPLLTLMYANNVVQFLVLQRGEELLTTHGWPATSDPMTPWEQKVLDMIGLGAVSMLFGCVVGIFNEDGHYRAVFATMNLISFAMDAFFSYKSSFPWQFSAGMSALLLVGLMAHAMEPGFLTKDKMEKNKAG